ncbi:hypothetical protein G6M78_12050 [Agrobacterium tumefaciens]|uniref:hypothetical protein n=1 Tax=Agrobacterium tumefaciens TaxID=358 RepID=UPI001573C5D6|nr:hypothetical protein [Agrobacterium tumefaciens]NTE55802.1 hypothetical protein [Agrobacterium tumefaciens]NTE71400.1 hypothetical protein [Agrobacterium tumefaciens]
MELHKRTRNQDYWDEVFSDANEPKKEIKPGTRYITLPGWHPTRKSVRGIVRTREPLMADAMIHIDTNPFNMAVAEFPVSVGYRTASGKYRERVPDLAVRRRDGSVVVIDVMAFYVQRHLGWPEHRTRAMREAFADLGAHYQLLDERTLHMRPLIDNLRIMWRHKRLACQQAWIDELAAEVLRLPLPTRIGAVMRTVKHNALLGRWGDDDEWKLVGEVNPAFTAIMQLAMEGKIGINLRVPFSQFSVITPPRAAFVVSPTTELRFARGA